MTAGDEKLLQRWKMCMYILFGGLSSSSVAHYGKFPTLRVVYLIWQVGCRQLELMYARATACIIDVLF